MSFNENLANPTLKPGRELDALIAEKVTGWKCIKTFSCVVSGVMQTEKCQGYGTVCSLHMEDVPNYSTDISAAFEVVEKFKMYEFILSKRFEDHTALTDQVPYWFEVEFNTDFNYYGVQSKISFAHCICLAALKAIGYEVAP